MISLFLNPGNKTFGGNALGDQTSDNDHTALNSAKKLIQVETNRIILGSSTGSFNWSNLRLPILNQI